MAGKCQFAEVRHRITLHTQSVAGHSEISGRTAEPKLCVEARVGDQSLVTESEGSSDPVREVAAGITLTCGNRRPPNKPRLPARLGRNSSPVSCPNSRRFGSTPRLLLERWRRLSKTRSALEGAKPFRLHSWNCYVWPFAGTSTDRTSVMMVCRMCCGRFGQTAVATSKKLGVTTGPFRKPMLAKHRSN